MTYPAHLYRECEPRTAKEQADKVKASNFWRRSVPLNPPVDHQRAIPTYARMGLRARA